MNILHASLIKDEHTLNAYRIWYKDKDGIEHTLGEVLKSELELLIDRIPYIPPRGISWDKICVHDYYEWEVVFDKDTKKILAQELITKLISLTTGIPYYAADDIVDEVISIFSDLNENDTETKSEILNDYLGLGLKYAWVFNEG